MSADQTESVELRQPQLPLLTRLLRGAVVYTVTSLVSLPLWFAERNANKAPQRPTLVKTYECRPSLPIRCVHPKQPDRRSKCAAIELPRRKIGLLTQAIFLRLGFSSPSLMIVL